jgi:hypothetical protein
LQTNLAYVISFQRSLGMSALHTKRIVSVPDILFPTPWARRPNSLAADLDQVS